MLVSPLSDASKIPNGAKVVKQWLGIEEWQETTVEEMLERTEKAGHWMSGTAIDALLRGEIVFSPLAKWKIVYPEQESQ